MATARTKIESRDLRHTVELQQWVESGPDSRGQPQGSWATIDTVRAFVTQLRTVDIAVANQQYQQAIHRVRIRYHTAISKVKRLVFEGRVFNIASVNNEDERGEWHILLCSEATE